MNTHSFLSIESLPNELLSPILEACVTPSLFSVCRSWRILLVNAVMPALYRKIAAFHIPRLRDDTQITAILSKFYPLKPNLTPAEKVNQIFKRVFNLAHSLSPQGFRQTIEERRYLTLANYSFYLLNINRLLLWKNLPGGEEYLNRKEVKSLPLEKKGERLGEWIRENCQDLTELNLVEIIGLNYLPPEIAQLSRLEKLDLSSNQLTSLPAEIGQLPQLKSLYLEDNQLTSLPAEIGQLSRLEWLGLRKNQLTSLPVEIGQLSQLKNFDLSKNQLNSLPAEIGLLPHLLWLYLYENQLTSLPAEIGQLSQLETLDLSENQLTSLPAEIGQLSRLEEWLGLRKNQLTSLPVEIGQLSQLETLNLSKNQLTSLPAEIRHRLFKIINIGDKNEL
ncbi:leucine-rich repeat domain-containing protein [Parachlamydia sp. AcF125]|uniref:leucine-rich repeat domain-containing protein n=1 Tax=Parachlamydia sp. AcF125 TaxID=2795736 RepID=UPI001BC9DE3A|nr:leucine-rich repeat domain-containing protein [Parachlamydia sp. AcF125]